MRDAASERALRLAQCNSEGLEAIVDLARLLDMPEPQRAVLLRAIKELAPEAQELRATPHPAGGQVRTGEG